MHSDRLVFFDVHFIKFVSKLPVLDSVCLFPRQGRWWNALCRLVLHVAYRKTEAFFSGQMHHW